MYRLVRRGPRSAGTLGGGVGGGASSSIAGWPSMSQINAMRLPAFRGNAADLPRRLLQRCDRGMTQVTTIRSRACLRTRGERVLSSA